MKKPVAKLLLPPPPLSGCLFAAIYRDTRGTTLPDPDRVNHFPASPIVTVTLVRSGQLLILPAGSSWENARDLEAMQRISVTPPSDTPISSWAPGEVDVISIGIYPDAWVQLGGDTSFQQLPQRIAEAMDAFAAHDDPETGWAEFNAALEQTWVANRSSRPGIASLPDWVRGLMARTVASGRGKSLRSLERRLRRFSGQTKRALDFYASFDNLHRVAHQNPKTPLAGIAAEAGYSDQSHMGRAVRRATGFSPARLNRMIKADEAFWCYRILGERF